MSTAELATRSMIDCRVINEATGEVLIYDAIGGGYEEGMTAKLFADKLRPLANVAILDIRINSPGGSVFEGFAIYNALKAHKARKRVHVDGIAGSIASVIAMAGDEINMAQNALMFIHDPEMVVAGGVADLKRATGLLETLKSGIVNTYVSRTGQTAEAVSAMMAEVTWMDAPQAVENGFATAITPAIAVAAYLNPSVLDSPAFNQAPAAVRGWFAKPRVTITTVNSAPPATVPFKSASEQAKGDDSWLKPKQFGPGSTDPAEDVAITDLCRRARHPGLTETYLQLRYNSEQVKQSLIELLAAEREAANVRS